MNIVGKLKLEIKDVSGNLDRLNTFINNVELNNDMYVFALKQQAHHMLGYLECLQVRVELLKNTTIEVVK